MSAFSNIAIAVVVSLTISDPGPAARARQPEPAKHRVRLAEGSPGLPNAAGPPGPGAAKCGTTGHSMNRSGAILAPAETQAAVTAIPGSVGSTRPGGVGSTESAKVGSAPYDRVAGNVRTDAGVKEERVAHPLNGRTNASTLAKGKAIAKPSSVKPVPGKLIPPPPPVVPLLSGMPSGFTDLMELMSIEELTDLQEKTAAELARLTKRYEYAEQECREAGRRSVAFDGLYSEGVVSRRELQMAKRESARLEDEVAGMRDAKDELEEKLSRIKSRLKSKCKQDRGGGFMHQRTGR